MSEEEREERRHPSAPVSHRLDEPHGDIPWPVALQQSRPLFLPAPVRIPKGGFGLYRYLCMVILQFMMDLQILVYEAGRALQDVGGLLWCHA